jgi:hypothetical protein
MPAPPASAIESIAKGRLQGASLRGDDAPAIAKALGDTAGQGMSMFLSMTMVLPGIPAVVDPISGAGATAGPGQLLPPPAGGPAAAQLEPIAIGALQGQGAKGEKSAAMGKAIAAGVAQGLLLFASSMMVSPGIAAAGFVTVAPGMLAGSPPQASAIEGMVKAAFAAEQVNGETLSDLVGVIAGTVADALTQLSTMALVQPGIPCTPAATAGPGRLS